MVEPTPLHAAWVCGATPQYRGAPTPKGSSPGGEAWGVVEEKARGVKEMGVKEMAVLPTGPALHSQQRSNTCCWCLRRMLRLLASSSSRLELVLFFSVW